MYKFYISDVKNFSKHTDYIIETKNANICGKTMFSTIFIKKLFFFRVEKNFDSIFFMEVIKKIKKNTLPDESRKIGKSQKNWDWLVHPPQNGS